jgi:hypothetical protein
VLRYVPDSTSTLRLFFRRLVLNEMKPNVQLSYCWASYLSANLRVILVTPAIIQGRVSGIIMERVLLDA